MYSSQLAVTEVWQEIKCYFCILAHILGNIESVNFDKIKCI